MRSRKIPILKGYDNSKADFIRANNNNEIVRLGIHVSCPPCNLACPYCLNGEGIHFIDNSNNCMSNAAIEEMKSWIGDAKELGVKCVVIDGIYEPLANEEHTMELLRHIRGLDITPILITNMVFLKETTIKELSKLKVSVLGKLNVPSVEKGHPDHGKFEKIQKYLTGYRYNDIYARLKISIQMLMDYQFNKIEYNKAGLCTTRLGIETIVTPHNYDCIPTLAAQFRSQNIYMHAETVKPQGAAINNELFLESSKIYELSKLVADNDKKMGFDPGEITPAYITGRCLNHLGTFNINLNGDVIPCPSIEVSVGNLRRDKLRDIIHKNHDMQIIRNLHKYIEGDCKTCELLKKYECYGGCRGYTYMYLRQNQYLHDEALIASDPSCWRVKNVL